MRYLSTAFIIPKYLIPTTFQRNHFDADFSGSGNRSGGFYRRSESRPYGGGGDDGLVVIVVAATILAASSNDVVMIHGKTRQWSRRKRSMDSDDHHRHQQQQQQRRRRSTTAVLLQQHQQQQPGVRWRAVQPARRSCSAVTERDMMMVTAGAWQPSWQHSFTAKRSSRGYRYTFHTWELTGEYLSRNLIWHWLRWYKLWDKLYCRIQPVEGKGGIYTP